MKSLQDKYNLIKEGKGNKELFLKEARTMFPNVVTNVLTFDQAIHNLSERGIISETLVFGGVAQPKTPDWFKIFNENVKADLKDTDKEVEEMETKGYDYKEKNNNNISTAEMLKGYYAEMRDPKNAEKTEDQIKAIVVKNLEKDPLFYVKDGEFGIKGLGYTDKHPGLGATKEVTGKYKSSGMEPVKLNEVFYGSSDGDNDANQESRAKAEMYYDKGMQAYVEGDYLKADQYYKLALKNGSWLGWTEQDLPPYGEESLQEGNLDAKYKPSEEYKYAVEAKYVVGLQGKEDTLYFKSEEEAKDYASDKPEMRKYIGVVDKSLTEAKKRAIEKHIAEIEKMGEVAAWEHRIGKIQEKIEELTNKMTVTEGDDVKDMVDKKAVKELKKDIALLEKKKALYEKQKAKAAKRVKDKSAMQGAAGEGTTVMEADAHSMPTGAMMIHMADNNPEKFKEYVKQMDMDPAFKAQFMKKLSDAEKEEFTKKVKKHSEVKKESWSGMVRELINKKNLKLK